MTAKKAMRALLIVLALWIAAYSGALAVAGTGDPAVPVYWMMVVIYWILTGMEGARR